jgi:hypothetical protein
MAEPAIIHPNTDQWRAWRDDRVRAGDKHGVEFMDKAAAAGKSMRVRREFPSDEARQLAEQAASEPRRASTGLSEGGKWLGLHGSAEEPLLDARSALTKAGVRPSDQLIAVTTREGELPFKETRWKIDEFLRKAPALRVGQHVSVEFQRGTEMKVVVAITHGKLLGPPELLREADVIPFMLAHPLTRKSLIAWWIERNPEFQDSDRPEVGRQEAEAALKVMSARELQNATLLMDMESGRPRFNQHQVNYDPYAECFKRRKRPMTSLNCAGNSAA